MTRTKHPHPQTDDADTQATTEVRILPTVGRVVWFWPPKESPLPAFESHPDQPCAATVAYVHSPECINLSVTDHNGCHHSVTSVPLIWEGEPVPEAGLYAQWMPYQIGQARAAST